MPGKKISVPLEEILAAMRKLLEGGEVKGVNLTGGLLEYTIGTLVGDIRITFSEESMRELLIAIGRTEIDK